MLRSRVFWLRNIQRLEVPSHKEVAGPTKCHIMGGDQTSSIKPGLTLCNVHIFGPLNKAFKDNTFTTDSHLQDPVVQWFRQELNNSLFRGWWWNQVSSPVPLVRRTSSPLATCLSRSSDTTLSAGVKEHNGNKLPNMTKDDITSCMTLHPSPNCDVTSLRFTSHL